MLSEIDEIDRVTCENIVTSPKFDDCILKTEETKLGRYKYTRHNFDDHVNKFLNGSIQSEKESDDLEGR